MIPRLLTVLCIVLELAGSHRCLSHAQCPPGYDLRTGIRRSGAFECWPHPVGNPDYDGTFGRPERGVQPAQRIDGWIYCADTPVVVDDRTVACR